MTIKELIQETELNVSKAKALDILVNNMSETKDGSIHIDIQKINSPITVGTNSVYISTLKDVKLFLNSIASEYDDTVRINNQLFDKLDITNIKLDDDGNVKSCDVNV